MMRFIRTEATCIIYGIKVFREIVFGSVSAETRLYQFVKVHSQDSG